jgi:hypothetical protein
VLDRIEVGRAHSGMQLAFAKPLKTKSRNLNRTVLNPNAESMTNVE